MKKHQARNNAPRDVIPGPFRVIIFCLEFSTQHICNAISRDTELKIFIGLDQYNWKVGSPIKGKVNSRVKQDHPSNFHVSQNIFQPLFREYVIVFVMSDWRFGMTWGSCWDDYCVHQPPLQKLSQQGSLYISTSSNISSCQARAKLSRLCLRMSLQVFKQQQQQQQQQY